MSPLLAARRPLVGVAILVTLLALAAVRTGVARADGPGSGSPWVATVGDSYMSGEGGRWAGNTVLDDPADVDAGGASAYFDNATHTAETIPNCHRSSAAEAHIGHGVSSVNFACSGATTSTETVGGDFKPGLDFASTASDDGQAASLRDFAETHNVKLVAISIGGNDLHFADIITQCVTDYLTSTVLLKNVCNNDTSVTANLTSTNLAAVTAAIRGAITHIHTAMADAGYSESQYTLLVQNYESPIPPGSGFRYSQGGLNRGLVGCEFWNADADWANTTLLPTLNGLIASAAGGLSYTNLRTMNLSSAFNGNRLCETGAETIDESDHATWQDAGASDDFEWIQSIHAVQVLSPFQVQESMHPNWWGEHALRNCLRQAYNNGSPVGGTCTRDGAGLTADGEPKMDLN
ncbi:hypothetical protein [Conexibacter woesei]|uniref:hypothetical protein n=1 Tax=Conexibacter woesei TaxID=191495 RepID=UPI001E5A1EB4|nr:hypothetical protein [Conexibacter woesei]